MAYLLAYCKDMILDVSMSEHMRCRVNCIMFLGWISYRLIVVRDPPNELLVMVMLEVLR